MECSLTKRLQQIAMRSASPDRTSTFEQIPAPAEISQLRPQGSGTLRSGKMNMRNDDMRQKVHFVGLLGFAALWIICRCQDGGPPTAYLGQTPPGTTREVFAQGVVSIDNGKEYKIAVSPDAKEIFFTRRTPGVRRSDRLWHSRLENGTLTVPEPARFGYDCVESDPCFTPDGKRLYFRSRRPVTGRNGAVGPPNIWYVEKTAEGWSEPRLMDSPVNDYRPVYFSISNDGTLYFTRSRPREIWYAELIDGKYTEVKRLPDEINYLRAVAHPAIAPDGGYIIVDNYYMEDDRIVGSLYISFKKPDGSWTKAVSMKGVLNASDTDVLASVRITRDGKYMFFEDYKRETDKADLIWISTEIIEDLRAR